MSSDKKINNETISRNNNGLLLAFLVVIAVVPFQVLFLFLNNVGSMRISEFFQPYFCTVVIGFIINLLFYLFTKSWNKSAFCTAIIGFVFMNYKYIEKLIQIINGGIRYWHIAIILIFIVFWILHFLINKLSSDTFKQINFVLVIVFGGLIAFNTIMAIPKIVNGFNKNKSEVTDMHNNIDTIKKGSYDYMPNVYWFIFDEYSNFDILQKYYDYDNYAFGSFAENLGFTVSYDSINESQQTRTILSNYINLDYIVDDAMNYNDRIEYLRSGYIFNLFKEYGYKISPIIGESSFGLGNQGSISSTSISGESFSDIIISNTILYPFRKSNSYKDAEIYNKAFETFLKKIFL